MRYFSTNRKTEHVGFKDAVLRGQPEDGGLYFPEKIPHHDATFWEKLSEKSKEEIAFEIIKPYVGNDIDPSTLYQICSETVNFDFPLVKLNDSIYVLELFHGDTLAFKDVGARFMSRCLRFFAQKISKKISVIVATSGDTGGAVASGFWNVENVEVFILYPKSRISDIQELQITSLGGNINAVRVNGDFDDCQRLVKQALADEGIRKKFYLTSANSINIARLLPQQFYYAFAYRQWAENRPPVISVPSGNFGNICALAIAHLSGLPCERLIAACNANDVIPEFLRTGKMTSKPAIKTLSTAMDVASPSNFVRILQLFGNNIEKLRAKMIAFSISDEDTILTMKQTYHNHGYLLDPHGAVGLKALECYLQQNPSSKGIFLETAHPIKFESVKNILGEASIEIPPQIRSLLSREKHYIEVENDYKKLKDLIMSRDS